MCGKSLSGFPQSLGHAVEDHVSLVSIVLPVGIYSDAIMDACLSCLVGDCFVAGFRASQSTRV